MERPAERPERPGSLPQYTRGRGLQKRLPGGDVVGDAGDGLQFIGLKGGAGDMGLGGKLGGIEESAEGDGNLFAEEETEFAGELVLAGDPRFIGGGLKVKDGGAAHGRGGKTGHQSQKRLPLKCGKVGVGNGRRNGIEEGHGFQAQPLSYGVGRDGLLAGAARRSWRTDWGFGTRVVRAQRKCFGLKRAAQKWGIAIRGWRACFRRVLPRQEQAGQSISRKGARLTNFAGCR